MPSVVSISVGIQPAMTAFPAGISSLEVVQKYSFNPNCTCLGEFACDVTLPNAEEPTVTFGPPNCGWLSALKASARNSSLLPSCTGSANCLNSERAEVDVPGTRAVAI